MYLVRERQPGRINGSGGALGSFRAASACWKFRGPPWWRSGDEEMAVYGVNVLPERTVSTNGGVSLIWSGPGRLTFADAGTVFSVAGLAVCSGIGCTKAKQTIAMMVATVAQALTKDRLIPETGKSKQGASPVRSRQAFFGAPPCTFARSGAPATAGGWDMA